MPTGKTEVAEIERTLGHFTGSITLTKHPMFPVLMTEGVMYLANEDGCNAWWLLSDTAITAFYMAAIALGKARRVAILGNTEEKIPDYVADVIDPRLAEMQFWTMTVNVDKSAVIECRADSGEPVAYRRTYTVTDFPLKAIRLWVQHNGSGLTMMLPSEY